MASVQAYTTSKGPRYMARWIDSTGRRRNEGGFTSKRKALAFAQEAQAKGRRVKVGIETAADHRRLEHAHRPFTEHLDEYITTTQSQCEPRHTAQVRSAIERAAEALGWRVISDIAPDAVTRHLNGLKVKRKSVGPRTKNSHRATLKAFTRWLHANGRLGVDPLHALPRWDEEADIRRERRPFSDTELEALLKAAPRDREMLYTLLVSTGLRVGEARHLTRRSFVWQPRPIVVVQAAFSKRRSRDEQPIPVAAAMTLRPFIEAVKVGPIWRIPANPGGMIVEDMIAAGIERRDDDGRVLDFHALRHTYITNLVAAGVAPKVVQALARHSTITLTMDRYAHLADDEAAKALDSLPLHCLDTPRHRVPGAPDVQSLQGTGTDGKPVRNKDLRGKRAKGLEPSTFSLEGCPCEAPEVVLCHGLGATCRTTPLPDHCHSRRTREQMSRDLTPLTLIRRGALV